MKTTLVVYYGIQLTACSYVIFYRRRHGHTESGNITVKKGKNWGKCGFRSSDSSNADELGRGKTDNRTVKIVNWPKNSLAGPYAISAIKNLSTFGCFCCCCCCCCYYCYCLLMAAFSYWHRIFLGYHSTYI